MYFIGMFFMKFVADDKLFCQMNKTFLLLDYLMFDKFFKTNGELVDTKMEEKVVNVSVLWIFPFCDV